MMTLCIFPYLEVKVYHCACCCFHLCSKCRTVRKYKHTQLCPGNRSQHDLTVISRTQSGMQTQMQKLHVVPVTLVSNRKSLCVRENLEIQEEETHKTFHTYCAPVTVVYTLTCDPCNNLIYDGVMGS